MFIFCTSSFSYWNSQRIKKKLGRNLPQTYDTKFGFTSQFPCGLFKPTDEKEEWKGKNRLDWRKKRMKREMEKKRKEKWNKFTKWWWRNWRKVYWRWYPSESQNHPWNRMRVCHCACVCISSLHFFLFVPPLSLSFWFGLFIAHLKLAYTWACKILNSQHLNVPCFFIVGI